VVNVSLQAKILSLLEGVVGIGDRIGIAGSILYIGDLYMNGYLNEDKARTEIYDICFSVIKATNYNLTEEEVRKKANRMVEEIMMAIKLEGIRKRTFTRFKPRSTSSERRTFPF